MIGARGEAGKSIIARGPRSVIAATVLVGVKRHMAAGARLLGETIKAEVYAKRI